MKPFGPAIGAIALVLATGGASAAEWAMQARLDGKPIGTHVFTVTGPAERREMTGRADFTVKVLGITAYRYHHDANESWRGDCLARLAASTDDDGKKSAVSLRSDGEASHLQGPRGDETLPACVMTFAYWNPAILKASQLLNPQSGKFESVRVQDLGPDRIEARGRQVEARHYRIDGPERPIELWYSPEGDWLGLDSMVGKRRLSYRLD